MKTFIKKYQSSVNDENLLELGELRLIHKNSTGLIILSMSSPIDKIQSDTEFSYTHLKEAYSSSQINNPSGIYNIMLSRNKYLSIIQKYGINLIQSTYKTGETEYADISFDLAEIKYCLALNTLALSNTSVTGDIAELKGLINLNTLALSNTSVTGDIAELKGLINLNTLALLNTSVTGDIAGIIENCLALKILSIPKSVQITDEQKKTLTDRGCTITIQ